MKQKQQTQCQVKPRNWAVIELKSGMFRSKTSKKATGGAK